MNAPRQQFNTPQALNTQCTSYFRDAFHRLFDAMKCFSCLVVSQNCRIWKNAITAMKTLHEKDSNSELLRSKGSLNIIQYHSKMFQLSNYNTNGSGNITRFQCIHYQEAQPFHGNKNSKQVLPLAQCMVERQIKESKRIIDTRNYEECKTNLDETGRASGGATSCRDSFLIALQNKQNELEKYIAFNDRMIDYDILLKTKFN
ncbi:hypothetical protein Tco_0486642 [Tanacetum coccineum]